MAWRPQGTAETISLTCRERNSSKGAGWPVFNPDGFADPVRHSGAFCVSEEVEARAVSAAVFLAKVDKPSFAAAEHFRPLRSVKLIKMNGQA